MALYPRVRFRLFRVEPRGRFISTNQESYLRDDRNTQMGSGFFALYYETESSPTGSIKRTSEP